MALGLVLAAALYLAFPTESIYGGRDEGVYANHGVYIAEHGRLDIPYPWPEELTGTFADSWVGFAGFFNTQPTMTAQFGHLFPVWLAQAFATFGHAGLFRLNAVFAVLSLAVFWGACRGLLPGPYALVATLFLAFNPSQLWLARITLSEMLTQLAMWSGLLLLTRALATDDRPLARWAGVFLGLSAFVRFDSLFLVPVLLASHLAVRTVEEPVGRSGRVWTAVYQTALPFFALAAAYFAIFSTPYLMERPYLGKLIAGTIVCLVALLLSTGRVVKIIRPWLTHDLFLGLVGAGIVGACIYAYWFRPIPPDVSKLQFSWPGYYRDVSRGHYQEDSLINLAQYLSLPVVGAGIAGWCVSLWRITRHRLGTHCLPLLLTIGGFSAVYLYDHGAEPDHFWVIRHFVPMVIPGFILCAALGAAWMLSHLQQGMASVASAVVVALLVLFTVRADMLIATFAEDAGYVNQVQRVEHLVEALPSDEIIVATGSTEWVTPLFISSHRPIVAIAINFSDKARQAFATWVARQGSQQRPAYLLLEARWPGLSAFETRMLGQVVVSRTYTEPTLTPLPKRILTKSRTISLYEGRAPVAAPAVAQE